MNLALNALEAVKVYHKEVNEQTLETLDGHMKPGRLPMDFADSEPADGMRPSTT